MIMYDCINSSCLKQSMLLTVLQAVIHQAAEVNVLQLADSTYCDLIFDLFSYQAARAYCLK